MVQIQPEYIVDSSSHRRAVVLSIEEWQAILGELEELDDIRLYDKTKAVDEEEIPLDLALQEIEEGVVR